MRHNLRYFCFIMVVMSTWINLSTSTDCSLVKREEYSNSYPYHYRQVIATHAEYTCENVTFPFNAPPPWNSNWKKTLVIQNSNLTVIDSAEFLHISDVLYLTLSGDHIKTILPGAFTGLSALKTLYLDHNDLTDLPQGLFNSLIELSSLDVSNNDIKYIHPHFLIGIMNLHHLNLSHNSLEYFNDTFLGQNYQLTEINLSYNHISDFFLNKTEFTINKLDVSNNNLSVVSLCAPGLNELDASFNKIRFILSGCSNSLTKLDISYNLLTETNINNISGLTSLTYLNLAGNNITFVSSSLFANFNKLMYLNMSHNKLKALSYGMFDNMKVLDVLDISYNNLTSLKRYLHSLAALKTLDISNNNLKIIDSKQMLGDMPNLKWINIDQNNFACNELIEVIHDLKERVVKGNNKIGSNIHGISCDEYEFGIKDNGSNFKGVINFLEDAISSKLEKYEGHEFERSFMYNYFNKDFKDSSFYKYLESLNLRNLNETALVKFFNDDFSNSQFYKFLENLKESENSTLEFNRSIYNYFNRNFSDSNLVKYLEKYNDLFGNDFEKTSMFNFFNDGFKDTTFYRYMENLKLRFDTQQQNVKSEYFHNSPENNANYFIILSVIVVLLITLVTIKIISFYRNFNQRTIIGREQVELICSSESV